MIAKLRNEYCVRDDLVDDAMLSLRADNNIVACFALDMADYDTAVRSREAPSQRDHEDAMLALVQRAQPAGMT